MRGGETAEDLEIASHQIDGADARRERARPHSPDEGREESAT